MELVYSPGHAKVECALKFFGPERMLFATDMPFGPEQGAAHIAGSLDVVSKLALSSAEREDVLHWNWARMIGQQVETKEQEHK